MTHSSQDAQNPDDPSKNLGLALLLNAGFTILELAGGLLTNSIAIVADALHDLGDSISLGLAWFLERYAQKAPDSEFSYGYRRYSLLGALLTSILLIAGSVWILANALPRLQNPEPINAQGVALLAVVGIAANGLAVLRLRRSQSLNAQVARWHLLEDVLGWAAILIVSIILLFREWYILDPIFSIAITLFVLIRVAGRVRATVRLLLQAVPENVNLSYMARQIRELDLVQDLHHMHLWSLDGEHHVFTAHVVVPADTTKAEASCLKQRIVQQTETDQIEHITIEVEFGADDCHLGERAANE